MTEAEAVAAVKANPRDPDAWTALGDVVVLIGDKAKARAAYQRALSIVPDHSGAQASLARLDGLPEAQTTAMAGISSSPSAPPPAPPSARPTSGPESPSQIGGSAQTGYLSPPNMATFTRATPPAGENIEQLFREVGETMAQIGQLFARLEQRVAALEQHMAQSQQR